MEFFVNEMSLHSQFHDVARFVDALRQVYEGRNEIERFGFRCFCNLALSGRPVTPVSSFQRFIQRSANHDLRNSVLAWISKSGPFWETSASRHDANELFTSIIGGAEEIVTDTSLAEAAFRTESGIKASFLSFSPSDFLFTPVKVCWSHADGRDRNLEISNSWELEELARRLRELEPPVNSWNGLLEWGLRRCQRLTFADNLLEFLGGQPFGSLAKDIQLLLLVLDELNGCYNADGSLNQRGGDLIQLYFVGESPKFTDESDPNKVRFRAEMTFRRPGGTDEMFCPFHGKIKSRQFRIHFNWPKENPTDPLYIVYIGPKLTKG